jgi:hypothetical protein
MDRYASQNPFLRGLKNTRQLAARKEDGQADEGAA